MTGTSGGNDLLPGLCHRLRGGSYGSVAQARRGDYAGRDRLALEEWPPAKEFEALHLIHDEDSAWRKSGEPEHAIARLAAAMIARPALLDAVVCAPDKVLDRLRPVCRAGAAGRPGAESVDTWFALCWTVEAAWRVITGSADPSAAGEPITHEPIAAEDLAALRPAAARVRFLVLSEPMRWRGWRKRQWGPVKRDAAWWDYPPDQDKGGVLGRALPQGSWEKLVDACRAARQEWRDCLDNYQSHRLLRRARPADLEADLRLILFRRGGWSRPLVLNSRQLAEPADLTFEDKEVIEDAIERHLLPRFAIGPIIRLLLDDDRAWRRVLRAALAALVAAAAVCTVIFALVRVEAYQALIPAAACYALICLGVVLPIEGWGNIWLLRLPAAAAVGIIALLSFIPGGWLSSLTPAGRDTLPAAWGGPLGWHAAAALGLASLGYLVIEARNHGVAPLRAIARALAVALIGALHALMVALIGLVVIAPAFTSSGQQLHDLWAHLTPAHVRIIVCLAAAWCLAFGVFTQILWDDQPISAPLAHIRWRREK
jgi:hypothetical protein